MAVNGQGREYRRCRECERARDRARKADQPQTNAWALLPQSVRDRVRLPVLARDGYRCQIRGPKCTVVATDVDHIVSWRHGGELIDPSNLRAACPTCNRGRRPRPPAAASAQLGPSREW